MGEAAQPVTSVELVRLITAVAALREDLAALSARVSAIEKSMSRESR